MTWASALILCPLGYWIVGLIAPAEASQARQGVRQAIEMVGLGPLAFLADITMAQFVSVLVVLIVLFAAGLVIGGVRGSRALKRLPCPQCGAAPLEAQAGSPLLLTCRRCVVTWEVDTPQSGSDGTTIDTGPPHF